MSKGIPRSTFRDVVRHTSERLYEIENQNLDDGFRNSTRVVHHLDHETASKVTDASAKMSELLHIMANEPSVGLYHVSNHVIKSVPRCVETKNQLKESTKSIKELNYDMDSTLVTIQELKDLNTFNNIRELLSSSISIVEKINNGIPPRRHNSSISRLERQSSSTQEKVPDLLSQSQQIPSQSQHPARQTENENFDESSIVMNKSQNLESNGVTTSGSSESLTSRTPRGQEPSNTEITTPSPRTDQRSTKEGYKENENLSRGLVTTAELQASIANSVLNTSVITSSTNRIELDKERSDDGSSRSGSGDGSLDQEPSAFGDG
eukprot:TRINITY_DN5465_c0_g1_i12.p1 TRINITY_DN5465_c0_g1~~TRINITY_DN5465_c0_g1_i12.p1  ORF type:complete len:321 (-),score=61.35 TRINITY_DN5465_c0_g1_i12:142-1104(-)